jgi:hypothetical protein
VAKNTSFLQKPLLKKIFTFTFCPKIPLNMLRNMTHIISFFLAVLGHLVTHKGPQVGGMKPNQ